MKRLAHLDTVSEEILKRIGRNMILFQQVEICLKMLHVLDDFAGYADEMERTMDARFAAVRKQTLGTLVERLPSRILSQAASESVTTDALDRPWVTENVRFNLTESEIEEIRASLTALKDARNDFAHHLLRQLKPDIPENATIEYLDRQYETYQPLLSRLKRFLVFMEPG